MTADDIQSNKVSNLRGEGESSSAGLQLAPRLGDRQRPTCGGYNDILWHLLFLADTDFFLADTDFFCRLPIFFGRYRFFWRIPIDGDECGEEVGEQHHSERVRRLYRAELPFQHLPRNSSALFDYICFRQRTENFVPFNLFNKHA